jgi:O-antigen ligase
MKVTVRFTAPIFLVLGLILPLAVFSSKSLAPFIVLFATVAIIHHILVLRAIPLSPIRLSAVLTIFLILAAASSLWSLTPLSSFQAVWPVAAILFCTLSLAGIARATVAADQALVQKSFLAGFFVGIILLLIESGLNRPLLRIGSALLDLEVGAEKFKLKPAATIAVLLFWPALILLCRKKISWIWLFVTVTLLFAMGMLVSSDVAILSLALGGIFFGLGFWHSRATGWLLGVLMTISIITAPWLPSLVPDPRVSVSGIEYLPNSGIHRIFIWQTTARHIRERPWLGHGFDTSRNLYPQSSFTSFNLPKQTIGGLKEIRGEPIPLHPHNMVLQVWLELGAAGAILLLTVLLTILAALSRKLLGKIEQAAGYGFFVTMLVVACVSYGAWQAWWLSAVGLCGVVFLIVLPPDVKPIGDDGIRGVY